MQQRDLLRRRRQVAKMPPQMFQPLYKRAELEQDFQRQMELAFEDMYPGERSMTPSASILQNTFIRIFAQSVICYFLSHFKFHSQF